MRRAAHRKPDSERRRVAPPDKAPSDGSALQFSMPSRRDAVSPMIDRLLAACEPADLSTEQRDDLAVALAEALANAAVHGNRLNPDRDVRIRLRVVPGQSASVEIRDQGAGFNHEGVSDPTRPDLVLRPGGRGVFLMRQLVDELGYNRSGNVVTLTVKAR